MAIRVLKHDSTVSQVDNLESGLGCSVLSTAGDTRRHGSSRKQCSPSVLRTGWAHVYREVVGVPRWSAIKVRVEMIFHSERVTKALDVDGDSGEELHHAVNDDPASETAFVRVHLFVLGRDFVV